VQVKPANSTLDFENVKFTVTFSGTVDKIIPGTGSQFPEKAQIVIHSGDKLYREIRVENTLKDGRGNPVGFKQGATVEVTIETDALGTRPKKLARNL
jgi:hypothetical protein